MIKNKLIILLFLFHTCCFSKTNIQASKIIIDNKSYSALIFGPVIINSDDFIITTAEVNIKFHKTITNQITMENIEYINIPHNVLLKYNKKQIRIRANKAVYKNGILTLKDNVVIQDKYKKIVTNEFKIHANAFNS
jgi:lipopolysaccharide export system protein LptA